MKVEVDWGGRREEVLVGGAHVPFPERTSVVLKHVSDGSRSIVVHTASNLHYLFWWHRSKRASSSLQELA